jgi:hypothetical protein
MTDDEPRRRRDTRLDDDHRNDLDAFNSDAAIRTDLIDGLARFEAPTASPTA